MFINEYLFAVVILPRHANYFFLNTYEHIIWLFVIWSSSNKNIVRAHGMRWRRCTAEVQTRGAISLCLDIKLLLALIELFFSADMIKVLRIVTY
jgi:hypothetical protein